MSTNPTRRHLLKLSTAVVSLIPLAILSREAGAATNPSLRVQYKYQDVPFEGKSCTACLEFVPGKTDALPGKCKVIPGDDEISPNGYCSLWNTM